MTGIIKQIHRINDQRNMFLVLVEGENGLIFSRTLQIGQVVEFTGSKERYPKVDSFEKFENPNVAIKTIIGK